MAPAPPSHREHARATTAARPRPAEGRTSTVRAADDTFSPPRNFTLTLEQRIGAAIAGPPAFAVRLKKIEDLRESLVNDLAISERESLDVVPTQVTRGLEALNRLIQEHNFAYPIERNLPLDRVTGAFLLGGEPWRPLDPVSIDDLRREAAAARKAPAAR